MILKSRKKDDFKKKYFPIIIYDYSNLNKQTKKFFDINFFCDLYIRYII